MATMMMCAHRLKGCQLSGLATSSDPSQLMMKLAPIFSRFSMLFGPTLRATLSLSCWAPGLLSLLEGSLFSLIVTRFMVVPNAERQNARLSTGGKGNLFQRRVSRGGCGCEGHTRSRSGYK